MTGVLWGGGAGGVKPFRGDGQNGEPLQWMSWNVVSLLGKKVTLPIVDRENGGWGGDWGNINISQITATQGPK